MRVLTLGPVIGGRPGVTRVHAARDDAGVPWAVKSLHEHADVMHKLRFAREIAAHVRASDVRGVVPAESGTVGAPADDARVPPRLVMAWAHGGDMASAAERSAALRDGLARAARDVVGQLLTTLADLHAIGIAHRDVKPSNLLLDGDEIWLTDFGIAAVRDDAGAWNVLPAPHREITAGTPEWAAPELGEQPPAITTASDVYAAARLWEWLRGLARSPSLDAHEAPLMRAMLSHEPTHRPSAAEAAAHLR